MQVFRALYIVKIQNNEEFSEDLLLQLKADQVRVLALQQDDGTGRRLASYRELRVHFEVVLLEGGGRPDNPTDGELSDDMPLVGSRATLDGVRAEPRFESRSQEQVLTGSGNAGLPRSHERKVLETHPIKRSSGYTR